MTRAFEVVPDTLARLCPMCRVFQNKKLHSIENWYKHVKAPFSNGFRTSVVNLWQCYFTYTAAFSPCSNH